MSGITVSFRLGQLECIVIKDFADPRPAAELLPSIPPAELDQVSASLQLDAAMLDFSLNVLAVRSGTHTVLIDTGLNLSSLPDKLATRGIHPDEIDWIVISHGHYDHIGGILHPDNSFVYPNARYIILDKEWAFWTAPDQFPPTEDRPARRIWQVLQSARDRVVILNSPDQINSFLPEFQGIFAPGHTPGHLAIALESEGQRLLHIVDAAHSYLQLVRPDWSPNFDNDRPQAAETRTALFERASEQDELVLAYHFPFPGLGHISKDADHFKWTPYPSIQ